MIDMTIDGSDRCRRPGVLGWILIALATFIGFASGVPSRVGAALSWGWLLLFGPAAFLFGFCVAPLMANAVAQRSHLDRGQYLWVFFGIAPLALQVSAFAATVVAQAPEWSYLVNASCPLGISLSLLSPRGLMEGTRNLL